MPPRTNPEISRDRTLAACALVFCATIIAYFPALTGSFLWNDSDYVTQPALRSLHGLWRIWFDVGATEQYYPLLHSAFWIEHRLWGDATLGYHLVNVLLHATSACLFGLLVERLVPKPLDRNAPQSGSLAPVTPKPSEGGTTRYTLPLLAALIFALHPVCVESVAWISEEKNTLSTVLYLAAALNFLKWRSSGKSAPYLCATLLFVCAILSKSVAATLPGRAPGRPLVEAGPAFVQA